MHPDGSGFFYIRLDAPAAGREHTGPDSGARVAFHRAGSSQEHDELVFAPEDTAQWPDISIGPDGRYLIISVSRGLGSGDEVRVLDLGAPERGFSVLLPAGQAQQTVVAAQRGTFYVLTDDAAARGRIVAVPAAAPARANWREIVPEGPDMLLEAHFFGGRLVCHYLRDACSVLRVFGLSGNLVTEIPVPELSTLSGSTVRHEGIEGTAGSDIVHFAAESFTQSPSLWRHNLSIGETTLVKGPAPRRDTGPQRTSVAARLRRRRRLVHSCVQPRLGDVDRAGRHARAGHPPRRRGVWARVVPGWPAGP